MTYFFWKYGFWLRFKNGHGFTINTDKPTFSERHGVKRNIIRIFGIKFEYLKPHKIEE
jgi:hypothetical protein